VAGRGNNATIVCHLSKGGNKMDRKAYIGRTDTKSICLTEDACYDILDVIMKYDPEGVKREIISLTLTKGKGKMEKLIKEFAHEEIRKAQKVIDANEKYRRKGSRSWHTIYSLQTSSTYGKGE
jgi:hypothetical protein